MEDDDDDEGRPWNPHKILFQKKKTRRKKSNTACSEQDRYAQPKKLQKQMAVKWKEYATITTIYNENKIKNSCFLVRIVTTIRQSILYIDILYFGLTKSIMWNVFLRYHTFFLICSIFDSIDINIHTLHTPDR